MSTDDTERRRLKKEWGRIRVRERCYVSKEIGENEENGFYAAGICPFLLIHDPDTGKSELSMLLVKEIRNGSVKLNFLGGKRERGELPNETSYREFLEETGGLLEEEKGTVKQLIEDKKNQRLWLNDGRYILVSLPSPEHWLNLPSRFNSFREEHGYDSSRESSDDGLEKKNPANDRSEDNKELTHDEELKTKGLAWIPVRDLGGSMIKPQLSHFLKSIFQLSVFEEFVNCLPFNPEIFEIAKYFETQKWLSSAPMKRPREDSFYNIYNGRRRRRLNDGREYPPRHRDYGYHQYHQYPREFHRSWGERYY